MGATIVGVLLVVGGIVGWWYAAKKMSKES